MNSIKLDDGIKFNFANRHELVVKESDHSFWVNGHQIKLKKPINIEKISKELESIMNSTSTTGSLFNLFVPQAHSQGLEFLWLFLAVILGFAGGISLSEHYVTKPEKAKDLSTELINKFNIRNLKCSSVELDSGEKDLPTRFEVIESDQTEVFEISYGKKGIHQLKVGNCTIQGYEDGRFKAVPSENCDKKFKIDSSGKIDEEFYNQLSFIPKPDKVSKSGKLFNLIMLLCDYDPKSKIFSEVQQQIKMKAITPVKPNETQGFH